MDDRYDWERERDRAWGDDRERDWSVEGRHDRGWTRSEWDRPERGRMRQDWDRAGDWRYEQQRGYSEYRNRPQRTGEYGGQGDFGNQGLWGSQGNRQDWSRGNDWHWNQRGNEPGWNWNPRGNRGEQSGGGYGSYGGGMSSFGGGMGSYGGGMGGQYGERGRFSGRGPRGWQRPDERIREDVNQRLTDHPFLDASDVEVQVQQCEVTLTGTVEDRQAKRLAEEVVETVSGVKEVHNQLRVQPQFAGTEQNREQKK